MVITGVGPVTPIGIGKEKFFAGLKEGRNGIARIENFDPTEYACQIAGEVSDFNSDDFIDKKESKRMDKYTQFAVAAAKLALADSKLDLDAENRDRIGIFVGNGIGGMETLHSQYEKLFSKGPSRISPFFIPMVIANMAAGQISIALKIHGPSECIVTACASGTNAIGDAFLAVQSGEVDIMFAGGTEAAISPAGVAGFSAMKALCTDHNDDPAHASRPFDLNRDGFVMGEGAGVVVLEELEHALARGAHIYAEFTGYGTSCDAGHITAPDPEARGAAFATRKALTMSGWELGQVDYINAHGTSTGLNDKMESGMINRVFGENAKNITVTSTKSMIGHCLGAAGGLEVIASMQAIEESYIHPTLNYETPDPECDITLSTGAGVNRNVDRLLVNSFGFGGHNGVLAFEKYHD